jgi:hypothetical protein
VESRRWHKGFLRGVAFRRLRLVVVVFPGVGQTVVDSADLRLADSVDLRPADSVEDNLLVDTADRPVEDNLLVDTADRPVEDNLLVDTADRPVEDNLLVDTVDRPVVDNRLMVAGLADLLLAGLAVLPPVDTAALQAALPVVAAMVPRPVADMDLPWVRPWACPGLSSPRRRSPTSA